MTQLNRDNYEMLMFDLLEGNIKEPEKSALLKQIQADAFYAVEWENWQKTVLPADKLVFEPKEALKKQGGKIIAFPFMRYAAAACVLLATGLGLYLYKGGENKKTLPVAEQERGKGKTPVKQMPKPVTDTSSSNSSAREEIVRMAEGKQPAKTSKTRPADPVYSIPAVRKNVLTPDEENQHDKQLAAVRNEETPKAKQEPLIAEAAPQTPVIMASNNTMKVTIIQEPETAQTPIEKIKEKRRQLTSLFSKPTVTLEKADNRTGYKVVVKNEEYKLIAGY